jgi:hypothetical protein
MNYKLIKRSYIALAILILLLSVITAVYIDSILTYVSINFLVIISASLCLPFFILRMLHEQEYPVPKKQKIVGYLLAAVLLISIFFI